MNKSPKKLLVLALILVGTLGTVRADSIVTPSDLLQTPMTELITTSTDLKSSELTSTLTNESTTEIIEMPQPIVKEKLKTLEEQLNPNRSVEIYADWGGGQLYFGDEAKLIAVLNGYDNVIYTLQWQISTDNINWVNIEGETDDHMYVVVTKENYRKYWRVEVKIMDIITSQVK